ncbi:conjugal transfer protein, partial [Bacillus atrophaeus]|nr:conjugal transfer protein [Bacillus atrophaeus]
MSLKTLFKPKKSPAADQPELEDDLYQKEDLTNIDQFLDGSSLDDIYPFSFEEKPSYIESGTNFIRVFTIVDYPKKKK